MTKLNYDNQGVVKRKLLVYQVGNGQFKLALRLKEPSVWLTQQKEAELI